jgi:DeoR family fructose operon transcriptional repressor
MIVFKENDSSWRTAMQRELRLKHILDTLERDEFVAVQELVEHFGVSHMTVRRDLAELEGKGYLVRQYGGAVKSPAVERLFSFSRRLQRASEQKEQICRTAARFIDDGDVIFMDCGTTLFRLCHHIVAHRGVRVITNSLPVVSELIDYAHVRVTLVGGEIVGERKAAYGLAAERSIATMHADKAFIGVDGLSLEGGLSSYDEQEAGVTKSMAEHAGRVYLLCDSSKIGKDSYIRFAPLSLFDTLVTDDRLDGALRERYRGHAIEIIIE